MRSPTALTIAGSDSGGGAGIQADLKAFAAVGIHGASAITCVTSQNSKGVTRIDALPLGAIAGQIDALLSDLDVRAVKTGMLHSPAVVEAVAERLAESATPLVVDPVLASTSGDALAEKGLATAFSKLARTATLITPNADELAALTGRKVRTLDDARAAGEALLRTGWRAVLVKGGHLPGPDAVDLLVNASGVAELRFPRAAGEYHGAGCTYASLIAGLMARGHDITTAVHEARARLHRALTRAYSVGAGPRVLDVLEMVEPGVAEGAELSAAAWQIAARLPLALVPEVGINLVWAPAGARDPRQVLALSRRIVRTPRGPSAPGPVVLGGSSHVARVLLAARSVRPDVRAAMNFAYSGPALAAARAAGLVVVTFDRGGEPSDASSTMEWGTTAALRDARGPVDIIADEGGEGKEAMMRLLARSPSDLVAKAALLTRAIA